MVFDCLKEKLQDVIFSDVRLEAVSERL